MRERPEFDLVRPMLAITLLILSQVNPADYPKVVHKDDGTTCIQSIENGAVVERCREGKAWSGEAVVQPVQPPSDTPSAEQEQPAKKIPKRAINFEPSTQSVFERAAPSRTAMLDPLVAQKLNSAMTKKAWSAASGWAAIFGGLGAVLLLGAVAQAPEQQRDAYTLPVVGAFTFAAAAGALYVGLSFSADSDIEEITAR